MNISGKVFDIKTKELLDNATVVIQSQSIEIISLDGSFEFHLSPEARNDSLEITHVGYKPFKKRIADIKSPENIYMEDYSIELRTVTVTSRMLNLKEIDRSLRRIKGNLYAYNTETTNGFYNLFLSYLEEHDQLVLLKQCDYDLSGYNEDTKAFYLIYSAPYKKPEDKKDSITKDYTHYPAVNVKHGAAVVFCQWLTEQYNTNTGKKKFKKVKFRLPTINEWRIAALGYDKFQSWNLDDNTVDVIIPEDTTADIGKGKRVTIPVAKDILYPWWTGYNIRNKPYNSQKCYMGNFKVPAHYPHCLPPKPGLDGWIQMAQVDAYFPNGLGLSDMVGNVAEMIDDHGKACGGSWNELPEESTIRSVKSYKKPDATIGFRVFMEVIE
jgi:formylglycine-generating enzyme required for sulfatase activity